MSKVCIAGFASSRAVYRLFSVTVSPLQPNAAGRAFEKLLYGTWGTDVTETLQGGESFSVQGHKGTYEVVITKDGQETTELFVVDDNTDITVDLSGE